MKKGILLLALPALLALVAFTHGHQAPPPETLGHALHAALLEQPARQRESRASLDAELAAARLAHPIEARALQRSAHELFSFPALIEKAYADEAAPAAASGDSAAPAPDPSPSPLAVDQVAPEPPAWVGDVFTSIESFVVAKWPNAGPVFAWIFKVFSILAAALTLLTGFLMGLAKLLEAAGVMAGDPPWLATVKKVIDWAIYVAGYVSHLNVQKPKA